jgi:hypothetical protein
MLPDKNIYLHEHRDTDLLVTEILPDGNQVRKYILIRSNETE